MHCNPNFLKPDDNFEYEINPSQAQVKFYPPHNTQNSFALKCSKLVTSRCFDPGFTAVMLNWNLIQFNKHVITACVITI